MDPGFENLRSKFQATEPFDILFFISRSQPRMVRVITTLQEVEPCGRAGLPGFKAQLCQSASCVIWKTYVTSLCLLPFLKIEEILVPPSGTCCEDLDELIHGTLSEHA